jgi:hypothetical protein
MTEPAARSWKYRRRAVFLTLIGSGGMLAYLAVWGGADNALQRAIADGLTTTIWLTIATYVGGATADDALRDRYGKGQGHEPNHLASHGRVTYAERD